jgi:hypothetical protein
LRPARQFYLFFFRHGYKERGRETDSDSDDLHEDSHTEVDGVVAIEGVVGWVARIVTEGAVEKTHEQEGTSKPNGSKDARLGSKGNMLCGMAYCVEHHIEEGEQHQSVTGKEEGECSLHKTVDSDVVGGGGVVEGTIGADDTNNKTNKGKKRDKKEGFRRDAA